MKHWQLQDAKARFSELVRKAEQDGPQTVSVHGKPTAVLVSAQDYARLTSKKPSFLDFMRASPLVGAGVALKRDKSFTRKIAL
jgi:antitoxin Phd